jgi:multicomponent Na+:H+ antiporter subunit D
MPWTSAGIVIAGLSLIGVPGTNGFISKWYLLLAAMEDGQWWLAFLIVSSSLLAIAYVWRFIEIAYLQAPDADTHLIRRLPLTLVLPAAVMVLATLYFGIDTRFTVGAATTAVGVMLGAP